MRRFPSLARCAAFIRKSALRTIPAVDRGFVVLLNGDLPLRGRFLLGVDKVQFASLCCGALMITAVEDFDTSAVADSSSRPLYFLTGENGFLLAQKEDLYTQGDVGGRYAC